MFASICLFIFAFLPDAVIHLKSRVKVCAVQSIFAHLKKSDYATNIIYRVAVDNSVSCTCR